ncbi:hypothetical protein TruAng_009839 [Truncatella angustata]|nr:hypothetical protein TruAng_009839 [Truncatella angustata]
MNTSNSPRLFALLVGVDLYQADGSRGSTGNGAVSLNSLQGCVNDVKLIHGFLQTHFKPYEERILTCSPSQYNSKNPKEPDDRWPTFVNIKREFDSVIDRARPGDIFFFHFSGHGALLPRIPGSPVGRDKDPSLMTTDYCCGKRAVRGWELNKWLRKIHNRKVQVIVTLDSCHSAGAWRNDGDIRSPKDWSPHNLPGDEDGIEPEPESSDLEEAQDMRKAQLPESWDINPTGFTLMAACQTDKTATEKMIDGQINGVFTATLSKFFKEQPDATVSTYRTIRDYIARVISPQKPEVFGQDRLAFLRDRELFSATPIWAEVKSNSVILPIGKIHGVTVGAEFTTRSVTPDFTLSISSVDDFESKAKLPQGMSSAGLQSIDILSSRWRMTTPAHISVGPAFSDRFRERFSEALQRRIAGSEVRVTEQAVSGGFTLVRRAGGEIEVLAPVSFTNHESPVRGLSLTYKQPVGCALTLAHLLRYDQLRRLKSEEHLNFKASLSPVGNESGGDPYPEMQKVKYTFENYEDEDLHVAVISLGAGFDVAQLFPTHDAMITVKKGKTRSFSFHLTIPDELRGHGRVHRDIVRTVVTKQKETRFKSMELPDIWNTAQMEYMDRNGTGGQRKPVIVSEASWCIQDDELLYS